MVFDVVTGPKEHWWEAGDHDVHARVFANFQHLDENQGYHRTTNLHRLRMYSNRMAAALSGNRFSAPTGGDRLRFNLIKSVIDAMVAKIGTNNPSPFYLTEKGNHTRRTRAKRLRKFVMGQFYGIDQYDLSLDVFLDACIFGTGHEHVWEERGRIFSERVFDDEVVVDDNESIYGAPRTMFRYKEVNRDVLAKSELGKKFKNEIASADLIRDDRTPSETIADPVSVIQAWHLPSARGAKDGKNVIAISNTALQVLPWNRDSFPIESFRLSSPQRGFRGIGVAEELEPIQVELNYTLRSIQEIANAYAQQVWFRKGEAHGRVSNRRTGTNYYTNTPPVALKLGGVPPELISYAQFLIQQGFALMGVSQLSAASLKPAGLDSGEALKTYNDIGTERFQHVGKRWEHFHVRGIAEQILDCAREVEGRGDGSIEVLAQGDKDVERLKFSDVSIERDMYVTKAWPVSLFPDTPSGKLDTIEKLAGISPEVQERAMSLMDFPDFDAFKSRINAPYELVEKQIELMVEDGKPQTPIPNMNLDEARTQGMLALCEAEKDEAPEDRKELLRTWLATLDEIQGVKEAPAEPPMPAPGPMGPPQPALPPGPAMPPGPMAGGPPIV